MASARRLWFKRKRYGWGWTPVTWQGWAVTSAYILLVALEFVRIDTNSHSASDTLYSMVPEIIFLTLLVVIISYLRGEKPRWQWSGKPNKR